MSADPRRALLPAIAIALAGALFASQLLAWRRVDDTARLVDAAQGTALVRAFVESFPPGRDGARPGGGRADGTRPDGGRGEPARPDLPRFLSANAAFGLSWVGLVTEGGRVVDDAGPRPPLPDPLPAGVARVLPDASLRLMVGPPARGPEGPRVVLAYTPLLSTELVGGARRNLVPSGLVAAALVGTAGLLWRSARQAERARAEAERARQLASLGEMSAVLAHEIRNPLASLKGHAQLLEEQVDPALAPKARRVVGEATRLEALCTDLLDFARTGRMERRDTDVAALVREVAGDATTHLDGAPPTWPVDPLKFRAVVENLLRNAAAASDRVELRLQVDGDTLVLGVRDHGPGLPPGAADRLFEPFFTTRATGTGLGLAVVRRVAEGHGGRATARTHPEGGAELTVTFPRDS